MGIEQVLRTIALISAWHRRDDEAVQLLITDAGPHVIADLIEFSLMIIGQNVGEGTSAYLDWMGDQARTIQASEADR